LNSLSQNTANHNPIENINITDEETNNSKISVEKSWYFNTWTWMPAPVKETQSNIWPCCDLDLIPV